MRITTVFCLALGMLCLLVTYGSLERTVSGSDWKPFVYYRLQPASFLTLFAGIALIGAGAMQAAKKRKRDDYLRECQVFMRYYPMIGARTTGM